MKVKITVLAILLVLASISIGTYLYQGIFTPYALTETQVNIPRGAGFSRINSILAKSKVIKDARLFYHYVKFKGALSSLQAGHYTFPPETSMASILTILQKGSRDFIKVTIPEGKNLFEVAALLENKSVIKSAQDFIKLALEKPDQSLGLPDMAKSLEGYLYPETYYFSPASSASEAIYTMVLTFNKKTKHFKKSHNNLSWHQLITLASIVEKETGAAFERKTIAGVFYNRLKKRMRLQSDPTTIYGIYQRFDGNLRKKDLLEMTAYNTYKIPALPPGPIANPGIEAINAALNEELHSYLYFVSKNNGTHIFSKTYKEHRESVNYYQKKRRSKK